MADVDALPLDVPGLVTAWVWRQQGVVPGGWRAPWLEPAEPLGPVELLGLRPVIRGRVLRLLGHVGGPRPPLLPACIEATTLHGSPELATRLLQAWLTTREPDLSDLAAGRALVRWRWRTARSVTVPGRRWADGRLWAADLDATLVPAALHLLRVMALPAPRMVVSGGHRLAPGPWLWRPSDAGWSPTTLLVMARVQG